MSSQVTADNARQVAATMARLYGAIYAAELAKTYCRNKTELRSFKAADDKLAELRHDLLIAIAISGNLPEDLRLTAAAGTEQHKDPDTLVDLAIELAAWAGQHEGTEQ